jgi:hypothetical protein
MLAASQNPHRSRTEKMPHPNTKTAHTKDFKRNNLHSWYRAISEKIFDNEDLREQRYHVVPKDISEALDMSQFQPFRDITPALSVHRVCTFETWQGRRLRGDDRAAKRSASDSARS